MRDLRSQEDIMASWKGDLDKPVVSICCIAYNHEPYIEDALEGFLIQETDFPFEILIHDDASTDKTTDIIREYESKYPKLIKPIYQTVNQFSQGKRINAEFNFTRAQGEYLAICEGDDYWASSEKLTKQIRTLSKITSASLSFHPVNVLSEKKNHKLFSNGYGNYGGYEQTLHAEELIKQAGPAMAMCSIVVRKRAIDNLKDRAPEFFFSRMSHFFLQAVALMQGDAVYLPEQMASYRYGHAGSWSDKCSEDAYYRFQQIEKFVKSIDELKTVFPHIHTKAMNSARNLKLRQALRLSGVPIKEKIRLLNSSGKNSFSGITDFCIQILLCFLLRLKNNIRAVLKTKKNKTSKNYS